MIDYYEELLDSYKNSKNLIVLDGCWLDIFIYSVINMWYSRDIKELQESIMSKLLDFCDSISKIYITNYDDSKQEKLTNSLGLKMSNMKLNRPLEIQYYRFASNFKNAVSLPSSDISECSMFILEDLKNSGYL